MAWIKTIDEDDANGVLKTFYKKYGDPFSGIDEILKIHSLNPDSLRHHYDMYKHLMTGRSGLSRMQREMIAVVVSKVNACHYWVRHHGRGLFRITKNQSLVDVMKADYHKADVPEKDIRMLEYAEKLTSDQSAIRRKDIAILRDAGFRDSDILDIAQIAAYYNYVNRLANGLGVELEDYWEDE